MWALRILKGDRQGSLFPLKEGENTIGRSSSCLIQLKSSGISKTHASIHVQNGEMFLVDHQSRNGSFVNGIQVTKIDLEIGDRLSFHNVIADVVLEKQAMMNPYQQMGVIPGAAPYSANYGAGTPHPETAKKTFAKKWDDYLEKIVLPGIYKLPEWIEFKWVIGIFAVCFILLVTVLSSIPLVRILKSSVETESMNHAQSIAEALARENQRPLAEGHNTAVNVNYALLRPGVKEALIINAFSGRIIAPIEKHQLYPESPFIHKYRRLGKTISKKVDESTVLSMVPIEYFNPDTTSKAVMAYSVVFFNLGSLSAGQTQTISLLVQSFFIAILIGSILFFFMYRMILHPFESLNKKLSSALVDHDQNISTKYQLPALESLCSNINSILERLSASQEASKAISTPGIDRSDEMSNLTKIVGFPCLCIQMNTLTICAVNEQFEEQTNLSVDHLLNQHIDDITDNSLKLNLKNVIEKVSQDPAQIFIDHLEFNSNPFQITAQGVYGQAELAYIILAFIPEMEEA